MSHNRTSAIHYVGLRHDRNPPQKCPACSPLKIIQRKVGLAINSRAMSRDLFDPTPEEQIVVLVGAARVRRAEKLISSCERCNPEVAEIPFDAILDHVTGSDPSLTDYILERPAKCPYCRRDVLEKTFVEPTYGECS